MLGGDFYRVEDLGAGRVAVFLADVSGHGVASALYAMQLRSLWEEFRGLVGHPPELLAAFNRRLHVLCAGDDFFATAVHVVIDAASGRAEWVAAGHPPPFLVRADGVAQLAEAGAALGLFPEAEYHASQRVVEPGETLLLCTDGAIEVFDAEGRELEESGLMRLLSGRDYARGDAVLAAVEEDLLKVCGHVRLADDLTLIAIHLAARSGGGP
jgi:serine phosphatase RsbU (regulator of sigma subunit)